MKLKQFFAAFLTLTLFTLPLFAVIKNNDLKSDSITATTTAPRYQIFDIGVVQTGDTASQGLGVSTGGVAVGRSFSSSGTQAFTWTQAGGIVGLPNLTARTYCVSNSANDIGKSVGTCATSFSGAGRLPTVWQNGVAQQLPLPTNETSGDANDVNASGIAVGSVNSGIFQRGVIYNESTATIITQTTSGGSYFKTAFGINNSGRVIGTGVDPSNAGRNVGMVYDIGSSSAIEVGALPGKNGALAFGLSNAGHVVGSSMQNQGAGTPFIWTEAGGMVAIPLPTGTAQGSARAVNSSGWAVGTASSNFAIPFLYDGTNTYRLQDLIPANSGWDLSTNTSSSALGISDNKIIVGTGVFNGQTHAYAMVPLPPQYQIIDIGVVSGDSFSQAFGISPGGIAVGRSIGSTAKAYTWAQSGGLLSLPNLAGRNFCVSNGANDSNIVAGTCSTTLSGSGKLPTIWQNGTVSQLPLPAGQTLGDANDVNSAGVAVGSAGAGTQQRGAVYSNGTATVITQTTSNGSFFTTVFGINDSGRVIGPGIDPNNAARTVGMVYDIGSNSAFEVGALPGFNSAIPFGISNAGHVVGASMLGQGPGMPFIWTEAGGMVAIPLPTGTNGGTAYAVNSSGWAVGTGSSATAIPFLYDGTATYRLQDLIPANSGWDLSMNTSSSARGISDNNIIVGTGVFNGQTHAYAMVPRTNAPNRTAMDFDGDGKSDLSVFRPSDGTWYYLRSSNGSYNGVAFGISTDELAPADYDGDGKTDVAVWRESEGKFYILNSSDNSVRVENFGLAGDIPTVGDYDGDGKADLSTYRDSAQSYFFYRGSANNPSGNITYVPFGTSGDRPQHGDFDGDGKQDAAVFRPSNGTWYILQSSNSSVRYDNWGLASDKFVPADYDGDGKTDLGVFREGVWYIKQSSTNQPRYETFGYSTDKLAPADYDGDGKADVAVFRNGTWYLQQSTSGFAVSNFGLSNDKPVAEVF